MIDTRDSINPDSVRIDVVGGRRRRRRPPLPSKSASCRTPEDCLATPLLASFYSWLGWGAVRRRLVGGIW